MVVPWEQSEILPTFDNVVTNRASGSDNIVGFAKEGWVHKQTSSRDLPRSLETVSCLSGTSIRAETNCDAVVNQRGRALTLCTARLMS